VIDEGGAVAGRSGLRVEHAQEVQAALGRQAHRAPLVERTGGPHGLALDHGLERQRRDIVARRGDARVGCQRTGVEARQRRRLRAPAREHRRARVLALELAHLPLPREQPERVVQARLHRLRHVVVAATRLESQPAGDGTHQSSRCPSSRAPRDLPTRREGSAGNAFGSVGRTIVDVERRSMRRDRGVATFGRLP
jgi:hypothetical protein